MLNLRKIGRGFVLPHKKIKRIIDIFYKRVNSSSPILDFGSGTLFWSEKFASSYNKNVIAFDILYSSTPPHTHFSNKNILIKTYSSLDDIKINNYSMIYTCDVLHHVEKDDLENLLTKFAELSSLIIIKDIDANDKIGNLQNKIHDLVINHQHVNDIDPAKLVTFFKNKNYKIKKFNLKKLGYPHFLLVAYK